MPDNQQQKPTKMAKQKISLLIIGLSFIFSCLLPAFSIAEIQGLQKHIGALSNHQSRFTGSEGAERSADYIEEHFRTLGLEPERYSFQVPIRQYGKTTLAVDGIPFPLQPFTYNAITPEATNGPLRGPLYYAGSGKLEDLDLKAIQGSIILMEFDSGRNWSRLASMGAKALIYLDRGDTKSKYFYEEKTELSPIQFPCFWMPLEQAKKNFQLEPRTTDGLIRPEVEINAEASWQEVVSDNIYALIQGSDEKLSEELVILEAFYDNSAYIPTKAPGADEAISIATLLETATSLIKSPPSRSVLLVATSGHDQTLAGMRDLIWSIRTNTKEMKKAQKKLMKTTKSAKKKRKLLKSLEFPLTEDAERDIILESAIANSLKLTVDTISKELMRLRLGDSSESSKAAIQQLANKRFAFRRLGWAESYHNLPPSEAELLENIIPKAISELSDIIASSSTQFKALKSAARFRQTVRQFDIAAVLSLHLSGHGSGVGGFHKGWLYNLKPTINRTGIYSEIGDVFEKSANGVDSGTAKYEESLRPSRLRTWDSWFLDKPPMGGEVSSIAGYIGLTLATTGDSRAIWGTPWDIAKSIDWPWVGDQEKLVTSLVHGTTDAPKLNSGNFPRNGFSTVRGRANLLLQGELFANYPASKTTLLAYQGRGKFHAVVDNSGNFTFKGIADKKNVLDKLIIEGYRFDEKTGQVLWAIDKKSTGKNNYRLKMIRRNMKTDLIMFSAKETTIFDLLEPRNLNYMTKLNLFDGKRDAPPQHYWYSRIDTRSSIISSIYTDPGTRLKLTLSDTILTNKMILTNADKDNPMGSGYLVEDYPTIPNTVFRAASDAWALILPRIDNLESHGIFDGKISALQNRGLTALANSKTALNNLHYTGFKEAAAESLALAARVYNQVEKTQKDVLFGVLFYIALFVPFAFCMERFLFSYANIYKRITAFTVILCTLITVIYKVHPAFKLAYSPMVIILAFFIIGLSFMVSLIIFFRFEEEMILLQRRATHKRPAEISHWKAFVAAFFLGVSNLRRRRIRTILTCMTLIILTFTIMSFTTIKSTQKHNRLFFQEQATYHGLLLKKVNWRSLPNHATDILSASMKATSISAPRVWLEAMEPTRSVQVPVRSKGKELELHGLIGLSPEEAQVTGLDQILSAGRWFETGEKRVIILEEEMAKHLGVSAVTKDTVSLWGTDFTVIATFPAQKLESRIDLDGEPLTPVTFPDDAAAVVTEAEQEAMESGDDVRSFQSRYQHVSASETAIIPSSTLLAMGGNLKNIAFKPTLEGDISDMAEKLTDRFSLAIFAGDKDGVWLYNLSDTMQYAGVPNIIIPLLISTLIVLNTMISSVYERKSEIAVYTSVGLAPSHVSFLFVAEAMALAVISVVLGYLFAQISAAFLSTSPYWEGITVNYSSLAGVAAMLLVIGVVLISVIYPSRVAAKIAIPDVNRTFALPKAVNDKITVTLPFFMKYAEHESIGAFIHGYFMGHQDVSHGIFSTGPVNILFACNSVDEIADIANGKGDMQCCQHISAKMWLAPFDFGIMQQVDIAFCPAEDAGEYLEIKATITRQAGEAGVWHRLNTTFLHALRKQLLVWRSIDDEAHELLKKEFKEIVRKEMSYGGQE